MGTFARLQDEVCVKFFNTPANYSASPEHKILYVSNPDKRKDCPPLSYDFTKSIVDMPIGYKCINQKDIARIVHDMLKASIDQSPSAINSYDLVKQFQDKEDVVSRPTLFTPSERNYINAHYHTECGALSQASGRRLGDTAWPILMNEQQIEYFGDKLWPLGVVMYMVHPNISSNNPDLVMIKHAMSTIELASCVVFQRVTPEDVLEPINFLWLGPEGEDMPELGFTPGNQSLNIRSLANGAPGHTAHTLNALLRALGVHMMSNRYDRDNYIKINWKNIARGKEHHLEKTEEASWLQHIPYDFNSATHAPGNYMCGNCADPLASRTVIPLQDHLWQRTLSMGRRYDLSDGDVKLLRMLYAQQCRVRFLKDVN
ncbi:hypothetical protein ABMA28_012474 [Loxostege sticticalis]|uniref:Metalloendopeptidase n=1 Tax=Loxostege sticticalis TaxID=481309 RepID=A0ABD0S3Z5_LOXSC